jgi:hypothetical protein
VADHLNGCCARGRSCFSNFEIATHAQKIALVRKLTKLKIATN